MKPTSTKFKAASLPWCIYLLLLLIFPVIAQAQSQKEVHKFTLEEALRYGVAHNPGLESSLIDEQIIEEQIKEVKGSALPQISGNGQFMDNFSLSEQLLPGEIFGGEPGSTIPVTFGVRYGLTAGLEVSQTLFNKQLFNAIKSTSALKDLYQLNTLKTTEDLVVNIARLYLQIQVTDVQRDIAEANYGRVDQLVVISQAQLDNGLIKRTDLNQLKVNRANLQTQLEDISFSKERQLNNLKIYLNIPVKDSVILTENLTESPSYPVQDSLTLRANIEYRQLQQQKALNEIEVNSAQAEYFPTLSAFFNYGYQGQTNEFKFTGPGYNSFTTGTWGLSLSVPIFDGFQRKHRVQQKRLAGLQLQKNQEQLTNSIQVEYQNALNQMTLSQRQVDNQRQNMQLADEVYDATSLSYKEGVAPLTELLDAETALQEAQSNFLSALLQLKISELDRLKTSGQLATLIENQN